jgi:hypothetical protein
MTTIEYDEMSDQFYGLCHDCPWEGRLWDERRDANLEADRHDEWHYEQPV